MFSAPKVSGFAVASGSYPGPRAQALSLVGGPGYEATDKLADLREFSKSLLNSEKYVEEEAEEVLDAPLKRSSHECALVDDHLHLFGGYNGVHCVPRNEIWIMNVRTAEKWICRIAHGETPPPCTGARCVAIDKMIYSYGGHIGRTYLGTVYRLDPTEMEWIEVDTPIGRKTPQERSRCCLCAIGSRLIMFGGTSEVIPHGQLQPGATQERGCNNEIYEFRFSASHEEGE